MQHGKHHIEGQQESGRGVEQHQERCRQQLEDAQGFVVLQVGDVQLDLEVVETLAFELALLEVVPDHRLSEQPAVQTLADVANTVSQVRIGYGAVPQGGHGGVDLKQEVVGPGGRQHAEVREYQGSHNQQNLVAQPLYGPRRELD